MYLYYYVGLTPFFTSCVRVGTAISLSGGSKAAVVTPAAASKGEDSLERQYSLQFP